MAGSDWVLRRTPGVQPPAPSFGSQRRATLLSYDRLRTPWGMPEKILRTW
jgi:hypothetical protein